MNKLEQLSILTNRSLNQTILLFGLLDDDFDKLILLESVIKKKHISYCPDSKEEIENILNNGN